MDPQLKQRVVGAAVLVAVGVVFIPIFLNDASDDYEQSLPEGIGMAPPEDFSSRVVPLDDELMDQVERAMDATPQELANPQGWGSAPAESSGPDEAQTTVAATRTGVTAWVVQVGSFSSEENAKALVKRLKQGGYTAFIEQLRNEADLAYRVRVGPELNKISADNIRDALAKDIEIDGIVMRYP